MTSAPKYVESTASRNYSLDSLRGIAVLLVLALHTPLPASLDESGGAVGFALAIRDLGWAGVDLFFVLSGFLISGLLFSELQKTGRLDLGRFWMRRGMKIWPSYFAAYGSMFVLTLALRTGMLGEPFWPTARESAVAAIPNVLFVQNYVWPETRWFASWSLAIEEHFYIALPIVLALVVAVRRTPRGIVAVCLSVCLAVPVMRYVACQSDGQNLALMQTHLRADALCFGVLLGYGYRYHHPSFLRATRFWPLYLIVACGAMVLVHYFPRNESWIGGTFGFTALYLGFGGLVLLAAAFPHAGRTTRPLLRTPLAWLATIGVYSYTIYVVQAVTNVGPGFRMAQRAVTSWLGMELPIHGTLFVASTLIGGVLLSHLVERPCLRLRERWFPKLKSPAPSVP